NGGQTWSAFATYPPLFSAGKLGGGLAVSTPLNLLWVPSNNGVPYYTKDGGGSWHAVSISGVPTTGETGWGWPSYLKRRSAGPELPGAVPRRLGEPRVWHLALGRRGPDVDLAGHLPAREPRCRRGDRGRRRRVRQGLRRTERLRVRVRRVPVGRLARQTVEH